MLHVDAGAGGADGGAGGTGGNSSSTLISEKSNSDPNPSTSSGAGSSVGEGRFVVALFYCIRVFRR